MGDLGGTTRRFARTWVEASLALAVTGCTAASNSSSASASGLLPTLTASPSPPPTDAAAAKAQSIVASLTTPSHPAAAAAFLATTYAMYASSLPDTAGIEGAPSPSDVVILVEIEGYFPASHSCFFPMGACYDTGIFVAFDQTLDQTLAVTYEDDPWSRDRPSPGPSVSERFALLRHLGTPVTLQLPN